jgi:hypothetical protein
MAAAVLAADIMDMDKAERSISRILPVRHPRCRDNNSYAFEQIPASRNRIFCSNPAWKATGFSGEGHEDCK